MLWFLAIWGMTAWAQPTSALTSVQKQLAQERFTIVSPFPPGGPVDVLSRFLAEGLTQRYGQPVVVENLPGAAGHLGMDKVRRAKADGHVLLVIPAGNLTINPTLMPNFPFHVERDFAPVTMLAKAPNVLVVSPQAKLRDLNDLLWHARRQPNGLSYASPGVGSGLHLAGELFKAQTQTEMMHVPYKGIPPVVAAALSGEVEVASMSLPPAVQLIKSGKLIGLAVTSGKRNLALPDVPTIAETGFPGFEDDSWVGAWVPAGTPAVVAKRLRDELEKAAQSNEVKQLLRNVGFEASPLFGEPFSHMVKKELNKWEKVVKETDTKVE